MEQLPRAWDVDRDSDPRSGHRRDRSLPNSALRYTSHGPDTPAPAHDVFRQANVHLDFLVVGGGIAGLAAAYALAASGHRVRVLEQARSLKRCPGGVRLPPNATRILSYWGVEKEVLQKASTIPSSSILDMKTGKSIGQSAWQAGLVEELGSEYLTMHHADLHEILHRLALSAGARVTFGATVESVEPAPEAPPENGTSTSIAGPSTLRPSVRLKTGEILHADVIVGADGQRSIVRRVVTEDAEPEPTPTGLSVYTGSVPMSNIRKYVPLRHLADGWLFWAGEGRAVLGYPLRRHQEFAIHVWWEDLKKSAAVPWPGAPDSWDPTTSLSSIRYKEGQMDSRLRFLLDNAGPVSRQSHVVMPPLESWVDESESIVLIGEAAHPQGPGRTYACSLALEDAAILGTLFSRLRSRDQVPTLLYAFQDLHKGRADAVAALEIKNADVALSNPPRVRDGLVRWSALPADEPEPPSSESGPTDAELADIMDVWGYFAIDAADECRACAPLLVPREARDGGSPHTRRLGLSSFPASWEKQVETQSLVVVVVPHTRFRPTTIDGHVFIHRTRTFICDTASSARAAFLGCVRMCQSGVFFFFFDVLRSESAVMGHSLMVVELTVTPPLVNLPWAG